MDWTDYVVRRRLNAKEWLRSRDIVDVEGFLKILKEINVDPPDPKVMEDLFPKKNEMFEIESNAVEIPVRMELSPTKKTYVKSKKMSN